MSMHLVGPYMTTTNYKKRKQKGLTKRDKQAQLDHDKMANQDGCASRSACRKESEARQCYDSGFS